MDNGKIKIGGQLTSGDKTISVNVQGEQDAVNKFFNGIVPEFIKDGVGILSDQLKFWRWKNQVSIIKNAQAKIESSGLTKKQIPLKVLVPIIQNSSLEEEDSMQEKWANMLANAVTGRTDISPNYAGILNELSTVEVKLLEQIYKESIKEADYHKRKNIQFDTSKVMKFLSVDDQKMDLIIENLYRLNLLQPPAGGGIKVGEYKFALRTTKIFEFTTLGYEFVKSCSWID